MTRKDRDDKRKAPTIDPNPHYWADIIFKNLRPIIAGIIVLVSIALFAFGKLPILGYPLLDGRQQAPV